LLPLLSLWAVAAAVPIATAGFSEPISVRDFSDIWLAGHAARAGVDPYDVAAFLAFGRELIGSFSFNWTYPPPMLFVAVPASFLPLKPAFFLWNIVTAGLFYWAAGPFLPRAFRVLALLTPAALTNFAFGQVGFLVGALWFTAFRYAPAAALLIVKPHMGVLAIPQVLGDWRRAAVPGAAGMVLILASALAFGGWSAFFAHATTVQAHSLFHAPVVVWALMATAPGVGYGVAGWLLFAAAAAWLLSRNFNVWTAATATFLVSPYGFHYDMTVACAGLGLLLYLRGREMPAWQTAVIALAFASPAWVRIAGTWFVPPVLLVALAVQTEWSYASARDAMTRHGREKLAVAG
jgi:alpha-1,2-mannosyltransferase